MEARDDMLEFEADRFVVDGELVTITSVTNRTNTVKPLIAAVLALIAIKKEGRVI